MPPNPLNLEGLFMSGTEQSSSLSTICVSFSDDDQTWKKKNRPVDGEMELHDRAAYKGKFTVSQPAFHLPARKQTRKTPRALLFISAKATWRRGGTRVRVLTSQRK